MTDKKKDVLQPVDDEARRQAKALVRTARHAALATIDPLDGSPAASRVSLATAMDGSPVFLISRLSGHFTNLEGDGRCSLLVGDTGKGDPLAHPRMTLIGRAGKVEHGEARDRLKARYLMRHPKALLYANFPDFAFWRFTPIRVSLNGGFGRAFALTPNDVLTSMQGFEALEKSEASTVAHMNADHADAVQRYALAAGWPAARWQLACIDPEGVDLVAGDDVARIWFDRPLTTPAELRPALVALAKR